MNVERIEEQTSWFPASEASWMTPPYFATVEGRTGIRVTILIRDAEHEKEVKRSRKIVAIKPINENPEPCYPDTFQEAYLIPTERDMQKWQDACNRAKEAGDILPDRPEPHKCKIVPENIANPSEGHCVVLINNSEIQEVSSGRIMMVPPPPKREMFRIEIPAPLCCSGCPCVRYDDDDGYDVDPTYCCTLYHFYMTEKEARSGISDKCKAQRFQESRWGYPGFKDDD